MYYQQHQPVYNYYCQNCESSRSNTNLSVPLYKSKSTSKISVTKGSMSSQSHGHTCSDSVSRISGSRGNTRSFVTSKENEIVISNGNAVLQNPRMLRNINVQQLNRFGHQSYTAPPINLKPKGRVKTSTIRNYDSKRREFAAIPQGMELYCEDRLDDDVRISRVEFEKLVSKAWDVSTPSQTTRPKSRNCTNLNEPKYNTMKESVKNIQLAIGNLRFLPVEIEQYVRTDPSLRQKIDQAVTRRLNVPPKVSIYKDLVSMEAPTSEKIKSVQEFQREIAALQPPPKSKDAEPNILDFNKPTFSRIKPQLPDPPPKPQTGVSSEIDDDFLLLYKENEYVQMGERDSNASLASPVPVGHKSSKTKDKKSTKLPSFDSNKSLKLTK